MRKSILAVAAFLIAVATPVAVAVAVGEKPVKVKVVVSPFSFDFGVFPRLLSGAGPHPAALRISAASRSLEWLSPPAIKGLQLRIDRHVEFNAAAVPSCALHPRRDVRSDGGLGDEVEARCSDSVVGKGSATIEFSFPEHTPITVPSELIVFKVGERAGITTFYALAFVTIAGPADIPIRLDVEKIGKGRFGTLIAVDVPVIRGGYGALQKLSLAFPRGGGSAGGKHRGLVAATCADGRFQASATGTLESFGSLEDFTQETVRPCVPGRPVG